MERKKEKHIACLGCRIRRRKCDNVSPICSGCLEISVPANLCIYHEARVGFKVHGSQKTLDKLRDINKQLTEQHNALQNFVNNNGGAATQEPKNTLPQVSKDQTFFKNPLMRTMGNVSDSLTHYGPISWFALISAQKPLMNISNWLINVIKFEKDKHNKANYEKKVKEDDKLKIITDHLLTHWLGESEIADKAGFVNMLLKNIAGLLPNKALSDTIVKFYSHLNGQRAVGFIYVDEETFMAKFNKYLSFDEQGNPHVNVEMPNDREGLSFIMFYLSILTFLGFYASRLYKSLVPQLNHFHMLEYLETLLLASEILETDEAYSITGHVDVDTLTAMIHVLVFEKILPHGRHRQGIMGGDDALVVKHLIIYARLLKLDKPLHIAYPETSDNYKKSLKSIWICLAYFEVSECLETGIAPKIKSEDLKIYKNDESLYIRSVVFLNDVMNQFNEKVSSMNKLELVDWIHKNLIKRVDNFIKEEFLPASEHIAFLKNFDFEEISKSKEYVYYLQMSSIRTLTYSVSASLFQFCAVISDQLSTNDNIFELLAIKRTAILAQFNRDLFAAIQIVMNHKNSSHFSVISSLMVLERQVTFGLRRAALFLGGIVLKNYDPQYTIQFFGNILNDSNRCAQTLMNTIVRTSDFNTRDFTLDELEDFEVEKDQSKMEKQFANLFDHKYLVFQACRLLHQMVQSMENIKYNLNFIRLHYIFFYTLTMTNLFLALIYSYDEELTPVGQVKPNPEKSNPVKQKEPKSKLENKNNPLKPTSSTASTSSSTSARNDSSSEFDFNDLFERAIDTNSDKFDFKSFFTTSNNLYQQNDIEEFLENLTMPLADYYSNSSQFH